MTKYCSLIITSHTCTLSDFGTLSLLAVKEDNQAKLYEPSGQLIVNNFAAAKLATLAGAGICMLGRWIFKEELAQGSVKPILKHYWGEPTTIWCYYSSREYLPIRVRLLIDNLVKNIERMA